MSTLPPLSKLFAPPDRSVPTMLARQAAQYGDRTYEVYSFLFLTYFLVGSLITFVARKLEKHLARGTR